MSKCIQPTLVQKVTAAIYVLSMWPELPGVRTINTLMWPYQTPPLTPRQLVQGESPQGPWIPEPDDVRRQAAKVLASVCIALLEDVPPQRSDRIWTEQAEYLSSALESQPPSDTSPMFREGALHPPANISDWLQAFSGPSHRYQPDSATDK